MGTRQERMAKGGNIHAVQAELEQVKDECRIILAANKGLADHITKLESECKSLSDDLAASMKRSAELEDELNEVKVAAAQKAPKAKKKASRKKKAS